MKTLITGGSSGFGALTAKTLIDQGHEVAASMRNINGRNQQKAAELRELGALVVEIDVTSDESVKNGVQLAIDHLDGLDVVINNAGIGVLGIQEQFDADELKRLFDVNVFGVQRVNRAALPHLRSQGSGLLIHISSILGRINLPFYSPYNASKWAVESIAEGYRLELSAFGVDSVIVEPGGFPTSFFDNLMQPADKSTDSEYGQIAEAPKQMFDSFEGALASNPEQSPQLVANAILNLIETPAGERPVRTVVDKMGMGDHIGDYNDHLDKIHEGILGNFGMGDMLKLNVKENA